MIDCNFFVKGHKIPKQFRTYFDAEGNIERVTGNKDLIDEAKRENGDQLQ